jgi:hypothetical protein
MANGNENTIGGSGSSCALKNGFSPLIHSDSHSQEIYHSMIRGWPHDF